jgi:HEAT repeat protein
LLRAYIEALGRVSNGTSLKMLVDLAMGSATDQYQELALEQLKKRKSDDIVMLIAGELKSKDNKRVNRAGYALGELADPNAIPALIDGLITKHKFQISSGDNGQMSAGFGSGGSGFSAGGSEF